MENQGSWISRALHWYLVLLGGGLLLLIATLGWLLNEFISLFSGRERIYKTMHPLVSIPLLLFTIGFGVVLYCLNITLVLPILMGITAVFVP